MEEKKTGKVNEFFVGVKDGAKKVYHKVKKPVAVALAMLTTGVVAYEVGKHTGSKPADDLLLDYEPNDFSGTEIQDSNSENSDIKVTDF